MEDLLRNTELLAEQEREEQRVLRKIAKRANQLEEMANAIAENSADDKTRLDAIKYLLNKIVRDPPRRTELTGANGGPVQVIAPMAKPNVPGL